MDAAAKEAIIAARGESKQVATAATRKYTVHFADGRSMICIDLAGDQPEQVERGIREQFWRHEIVRIER